MLPHRVILPYNWAPEEKDEYYGLQESTYIIGDNESG
jgi:hypothetical protein